MSIRIAVLGDRNPDHLTHRELDAALALLPAWAAADWVPSDTVERQTLDGFDALWVVPGSPYRDEGAVYAAIGRAREGKLPTLGTCSGFQYMALEFARNVAGLVGAGHAETAPGAGNDVVAPLSCSLVGERRTVTCVPGTRLAALCGTAPFDGFHWCNYGLAAEYVGSLEAAGLVVSAHARDAGVEGIELPGHPFFIATLFQPQVGALAGRPLHPLVSALADAARAGSRRVAAHPGRGAVVRHPPPNVRD